MTNVQIILKEPNVDIINFISFFGEIIAQILGVTNLKCYIYELNHNEIQHEKFKKSKKTSSKVNPWRQGYQ